MLDGPRGPGRRASGGRFTIRLQTPSGFELRAPCRARGRRGSRMRTASLTERRLLSLALAFVATTLVHHRHYSQHDAADPFVKVTPPKARFVEAAAVPIALVPDARVCHGRGDNESARSLPLAAHELVFVGGMDALLGALATRLVERSLPCGSALGADAAKSPSVKAPSAKKEPAPHRMGSSFGDLVNMARLKAQGGEAFKLEQKQYQRDRASNERRERAEAAEVAESAARTTLQVLDAIQLARAETTATASHIPEGLCDNSCAKAYFRSDVAVPSAELADDLMRSWLPNWERRARGQSKFGQLVAASPSVLALAPALQSSFALRSTTPRFVFVMTHPITHAFNSDLRDERGTESANMTRDRDRMIQLLVTRGVAQLEADATEAKEWAQLCVLESRMSAWSRMAEHVTTLLKTVRGVAVAGEALLEDASVSLAIATATSGPVSVPVTNLRLPAAPDDGSVESTARQSGRTLLRGAQVRAVCWHSGKEYNHAERSCDGSKELSSSLENWLVRMLRCEAPTPLQNEDRRKYTRAWGLGARRLHHFASLRATHSRLAASFGYSFTLHGVGARAADTTSEVFDAIPGVLSASPGAELEVLPRVVLPLFESPQLREDSGGDRGGGMEGKNVLIIYHQLWAENSNHGGMFERMTDLVWTAHELGATVSVSLLLCGANVPRRRPRIVATLRADTFSVPLLGRLGPRHRLGPRRHALLLWQLG